MNNINGIYVPLITPFLQNGEVDYVSLEKLSKYYLDSNIAGIVALGSTAEAALLTLDEKIKVLTTIAKLSKEANKQCMVGVGSAATNDVLSNIDNLCSVDGVTSTLLVAPYYVKPSQQGILDHFETVTEYTNSNFSIPTILYNVPSRTGVNVSVEVIEQLSKNENILGLKQAVGALDSQTIDILRVTKDNNFSLLAGDDSFFYPSACMGAKGAIAATAHFHPNLWVKLNEAAQNNNSSEETKNLSVNIAQLVDHSFAEPNPTVFKGVLARLGLIGSDFVRMPLLRASQENIEATLLIYDKLK